MGEGERRSREGDESLSARLQAAGDAPDGRLIWSLALPVLAQNFLGMFVGVSDTFLAGRILGEEAYLAAGIVAGYLLWMLESCGSLIHTGSTPIVARLLGAGKVDEANRVAMQAVLMAVVLGAGLGFATWLTADPATRWMNLEGRSQAAAAQYLRIVAVSGAPMMLLMVGTSLLRAAGHTVPAMWILLLVNFVNIAASWTLTVGVGPIPRLGWAGIAIGTASAFVVGGAVTVALLWRGYRDMRLPRSAWRPDGGVARRILRIGVPGATSGLLIVVCQLWFLAIIGRLGDEATAAHGVAIRCESLSWLCGDAFAIAAATLVGQSLGLLRPELARRYAWRSFGVSTAVLALFGVVLLVAADWLVAIFARSDAVGVREQGATMLRIVALGMPALSASIVLTGALQGAGDTRGPLIYNTVGMLLFRIPLAYLLTQWFAFGLAGAWAAMVADLYVRGGLSVGRFLSGRWIRMNV